MANVELSLFVHVRDSEGGLEHHLVKAWAAEEDAPAVVRSFYANPEGSTSVHEVALALYPQEA